MLYVIAGPTASGKTAIAIALAQRIGGEVVSADSMQVYRGMDIGTAKPTLAEREGIPHHLLDVVMPDEPFSAARYQQLAQQAVADIQKRGNIPILAGGTGFYINAVVYGTDFPADEGGSNAENNLRDYYTALANEKGADFLHALLAEKDPPSANAIHPRNIKRTARALAFCEHRGTLFSAHNEAQRRKQQQPRYDDTRYIVLTLPRAQLYERINQRTANMFDAGLAEEAERLLAAGYSPRLPAMQAIGYKEILAAPAENKPAAIPLIAQATRNYAKRQITWFNNSAPHACYTDASSADAALITETILNIKE
jgi:tRNA dimethylallyltransferase